MRPLTLLFDTNLFIACEDIRPDSQHPDAVQATELKRVALAGDHRLVLLPATRRDILQDQDLGRRNASLLKMYQWAQLESPYLRPDLAECAGYPSPLSPNDTVDLEMLAAIDCDAADFLVTQDRDLRSRAAQLDLNDRVLSLRAAIEYLRRLRGDRLELPAVCEVPAYTLATTDPIFDSLRAEYQDFDDWFRRVRQEHRPCCTIQGAGHELEALSILKTEQDRPHGLAGNVLKICTLKVADHAVGVKRGELLLRAVFDHASHHDHDTVYVEVFPRHEGLMRLLERFGFSECGRRTRRDELVMVKHRRPDQGAALSPLDYHIAFGPPALLVHDALVVPVRPRWHDMLFPEVRAQKSLLPEEAHGNAMLKAYLSRSQTTRVHEGAVVLFYRSRANRGVTVVGVVDGVCRTTEPEAIRRFVGQRTVYSDTEIARLCTGATSGVLAILFRQDRVLPEPWGYEELCAHGVLGAPPQSIQQVRNQEAIAWIRNQLHAAP